MAPEIDVGVERQNSALVAFGEFQTSDFKTPEEKEKNNRKVFVPQILKNSYRQWGELGFTVGCHPACVHLLLRERHRTALLTRNF